MAAPGRPRSEQAHRAVLRAVDDLLVEQGYAAMSMKSIAERAGVGRQTLYRWWSHKAEILMEAAVHDAGEELIAPPRADATQELIAFAELLLRFLTVSPAGLSYRALLGEAQYDPRVAALVADQDPVREAAAVVVDRIRAGLDHLPGTRIAVAQLVGPVMYAAVTGSRAQARTLIGALVPTLLRGWA
ncbi:MAG: TetR/AcrR family transcriptional regulator [Nocardioides sp.]|uniref:TetR/AcrR family transcriptional regulator n=1 Tax=Nocardioides sp. TaxID=35761 RepID=UPI0039E6EA22